MVTIYVDGRAYGVERGQNLLQACLALGFDLPYFCWHPALGSVGACRQCAVKQFRDDRDRTGELVMACMTPAAEGTRISVNDPEAVQFRAGVIEWLMINHPHDCPVCDEGGECHLQDMTVMTGHNYRRYRFAKRTYRNQNLGPFLDHEMNRCIQCYRCVRFYRDYAGGRDLDVFASRNRVYFGRAEDGRLENEFSGNLVEVCPTGVFTDKPQGCHYSRKWDLQSAPSLCVHCGLGCNTLPGERYGTVRRVRNRYHHLVNGHFLCDRGRYGYEFVNSERRIRQPLLRTDQGQAAAGITEALERAAAWVAQGRRVIGIGSPRASLESNFALRRLVGERNFFAGFSARESQSLTTLAAILIRGTAPSSTLQATGLADAVLVLGEDVTAGAPLLALNLRRLRYRKTAAAAGGFQLPAWNDAAVRQLLHLHQPHLFVASTAPTRLDGEALRTVRAPEDELALFGFAVSQALERGGAAAPGELNPQLAQAAAEAACALLQAQNPLVITGAGAAPALLEAAANIAWRLQAMDRAAQLFLATPECNSLGLALMQGRELAHAFGEVSDGRADSVVILENDLYRRAKRSEVDELLRKARVIMLDHLTNATSAGAGIVLPSATFAEASGTLVNNEGRAQRHYAVMPPTGAVQASWRWLQELARLAGVQQGPGWRSLDEVTADLATEMPFFQPATHLGRGAAGPGPDDRVARQPHRFSGRTAMHADRAVHEPKPAEDPDSMLAFSMEGYQVPPPAGLTPRFWAPGWNSGQSLHKFQAEIDGPLRHGEWGYRLISPQASGAPEYFAPPPAARSLGANEFWVVPIHHFFGSEELSMASPPVAQSASGAYLALAPENGLAGDGDRIALTIQETALDLPVRLLPGLPERCAGLPVGLPGWPALSAAGLPAVLKISSRV